MKITPKTCGRMPDFMKRPIPPAGQLAQVAGILEDLKLNTVCRWAQCPNRAECYARGTATFLILGDRCTRNCRFCAVPSAAPLPPRPDEPAAVAEACARLGLRHVVITSVTRDDLPDGGARHFAQTLQAVRKTLPQATLEVLVPDFQGRQASIDTVLAAGPDVFNHNVETVPRLYPSVRPQADYLQSLNVLAYAASKAQALGLSTQTKSGLMVGLGETMEEVQAVLKDLRAHGVQMVTIGQYLAPAGSDLPVRRYVTPEEYSKLESTALSMGFASVFAGPYVRSSYQAQQVYGQAVGQPPAGPGLGDKSQP